jgi:oligopeptide transport system ATP-binding protein
MASVPVADPEIEARRPQQLIVGEVPSVRNPPSGCRFHPRCPQAQDRCRSEPPALSKASDGRQVACVLYEETHVESA